MYNTTYWNKYYSSHEKLKESSFSKFCLDSYIKPNDTLLDICCGDGRDSVYFKENNINTYAFDIHDENYKLNINYFKYNLNNKKRNFGIKEKLNHVYCRFTLHAVPENLEDYILVNSNSILKNGGLLFIETRSNKGIIPDAINDHFRRLTDKTLLENKLKNLNFEIIYQEEKSDLSATEKENPVLIRIVAKKIGNPSSHNLRTFWETLKTIGLNKNLDKQSAQHLLESTKNIFDSHNINFLLVFGTLLGAYRENDFIDHDTDVDIAILDNDKKKIFDLINQGYFKLHGISVSRNDNDIISLDNNKAYIDFYFFKETLNDNYKCSIYSLSKKQVQLDKPNKIKFLGNEYSTVSNIEEYLAEKYGNDWETPIKTKHAIT